MEKWRATYKRNKAITEAVVASATAQESRKAGDGHAKRDDRCPRPEMFQDLAGQGPQMRAGVELKADESPAMAFANCMDGMNLFFSRFDLLSESRPDIAWRIWPR